MVNKVANDFGKLDIAHLPDLNVQPVIGDEDVEIAFLREQTRRNRQ